MKLTETVPLKSMSIRLFLVALFIGWAPICAADSICNSEISDPPTVLNQFLEDEFRGEADVRMSCTVFAKGNFSKTDKPRQPTVSSGGVVSLVADPIVIVDSYVVGEIATNGDRAIASVSFNVIGVTKGYGLPGRSIHAVHSKCEKVRYSLIKDDGKWFVLNPGLPHVSFKAIVKQYEEDVVAMEFVLTDPRASGAQKTIYEKLRKELRKAKAMQPGGNCR